MGIVLVDCFAVRTASETGETTTSTFNCTSSVIKLGIRSAYPRRIDLLAECFFPRYNQGRGVLFETPNCLGYRELWWRRIQSVELSPAVVGPEQDAQGQRTERKE